MTNEVQTIRITERALLAATMGTPHLVSNEFQTALKEGAVLDHGPNGFWWWRDEAWAGGDATLPERVAAIEAALRCRADDAWPQSVQDGLDNHLGRLNRHDDRILSLETFRATLTGAIAALLDRERGEVRSAVWAVPVARKEDSNDHVAAHIERLERFGDGQQC